MADAASDAVTDDEASSRPALKIPPAGLQSYARDRLAAALAYPKDDLVRRDIRLAGLDLTVWSTGETLAKRCEGALVTQGLGAPSSIRVEIFAMDAEADGWDPPAKWDEAIPFSSWDFDRILAARNYRGFYYHDAPSWQFYDRARGVGVQTLPTPLAMPPWESSAPLRLFLHWAYAAAGMRLTHAATLGLNGRGALLAGPSGSGKSATTLAGLVNGLDSVGDDYVLLEADSRVIAHPVFAALKQDREGLRRVGIAMGDVEAAELNWRGKVEFDAGKVSRRPLGASMEIRALLLPEIARTPKTRFDRVTTHEAAMTLAPSGVFQLPGDTTEGFRFLARVARRLPAYRVKLSEDPTEIAEALGSFLSRADGDAG